MNGSKYDTEAAGVGILRMNYAVGERRTSDTSRTERNGVGVYG